MPGETGEVSSIGVKLTLDAGEFMGGMKAAQGTLNTFQKQAAQAGSGAGQLKAGGGKQAASGPSSAQNLSGVNVSLTLSDSQLAQLRKRVQGALQNIPITITTAGSKSARAEAQSVMAAVSTPAIGTRTGAAHAVDRAVRQNLPQKAHGGPVQAGRAVIVGERRPEVFIPRSHGRIEPDAERFYRQQEQHRRREAELAALEYTAQRRHEREMGRFAGGPVEGPLARRIREGAYRPSPPPPVEQPQPVFEPEWMRRAREQRLPPKVFRAQGGPAKRGGLPRGYHMEFYSLATEDQTLHSIPSLDRPNSYYRPVKKPIIKGPRDAAGVVAVITKGSEVVGTYPFSFDSRTSVQGVPTPFGSFHPDYSRTAVEHRRKGLATAAYVKLRRLTGRPVAPSGSQLDRGKAFWAQPNRPFGQEWGPRPISSETAEGALRDETRDRERLEDERRFANAPSFIQCPECGPRAGSFTSQFNLSAHYIATHPRPTYRHDATGFPTTNIPSTSGGRSYGIEPPPYDDQGRPSFGSSASISRFSRTPIRDRIQARARMLARAQPGYRSLWSQERWGGYQPGEAHEVVSQERQWRDQTERMTGVPAHNVNRARMFMGMPGFKDRSPLVLRSGGHMVDAGPISRIGKMAGGPVENVSVAALRKMLYEDREHYPRSGPGATILDELTADIAAHGIQRPIALSYDPTHHAAMVGDGNTRMAAAIRLGLKSVPAYAQSIGPQTKRHYKLVGLSGDPVNAARGEMLAPSLLGIRRQGGPAHAGAGAIALRATLANEGGTFPLHGGPQPSHGYAVGIATGTSQIADPNDPRDFLRKYNAQRKAQMAAGDFPPFVGTWLHQGQIHIDPAAVLGRRREADLVARAKEQLAFFDLKRFDEIPTSSHKLRATSERVNELIMSGRRRQEGGPVEYRQRGGRAEERRTVARGITRSYGNIRNWENAQWRDQERREIEDAIRAAHEARIKTRIPGFAENAWADFPLPAEPLAPLAGETLKLFGEMDGGPVHAKKGAVVGRMTPGEMDFAGNLRAAAARISSDQMKFGKVWYADAQGWINEQSVRYGIDPTTVRGVTAALSAGTSWEANKTKAHRVLQTHRMGLFGESFPYNMRLDAHGKARAILEGADPEGVLGHTPKVGSFYRNLGGDLDALTLDRWAFRTATRGHLSAYGEGPVRNDIDAAYRQVAAELGLHPAELQAASWLYEKETNPLPKKGKPQSLGQLEDMFSPMRRASGGVVKVGDPMGLHMRPSGLLARVSALYPDTDISLGNGANAKEMLSWYRLWAHQGTPVEINAQGPQESLAIHQLSRLIRSPRLTRVADRWSGMDDITPKVHRASGGVAIAGQPHGLVHPGGGMISQIFQTAADWANDPFMAIMSYQSMQAQKRMAGGPTIKGKPRGIRFEVEDGRPGVPMVGVRAFAKDRRVGSSNFEFSSRLGGWYPTDVGVQSSHQRRGVGSWMYAEAEKYLGDFIHPSDIQSPFAQGMWRSSARPFGGDRDAVPGQVPMFWKARRWPHRQEGGKVRKLFTVADELGLHMRPSAHLARMAADYDAVITIQNMTRAAQSRNGRPPESVYDAKRMWHWLNMGAKQGNQIMLEASGVDAEPALRALGTLIESPGLTRIASANRSLEKVDSSRLRAAEIFGKFSGRAEGGPVMSPWVRRALENQLPAKELSPGGKGLYVVGEIGPELFVPNRLAGRIPKKVMDQIPRAANGGIVEIGRKRNELFAPPEDGIIIPNRLIDQIPHAAGGLRVPPGPGEIDPFWSNPQSFEERLVANLSTPQLRQYPSEAAPSYGVSPGYRPSQMTAQAPQTIQAQTVTVQSAGATTVNTQNATAAGAAGAAAAVGGRRLSPGLQNIGGVAVPQSASPEELRSLRTRLANMSPAAAAQLSGMQTAEEAGATYEEHLRKTVATGGVQGSRERRYRGVNMAEELAQGRAGVGKEMPSRTPQGAIAAVSSFLFGGVQQMTQAQVVRTQAEQKYHNAQRYTEAVVNKAAGSVKKLREEVAAGTVTNVDAADIVKNKLAPAVREARAVEKNRYEDLERATKKTMPTTGGVLRNLGVIIGATTAYGMAMQAASMVIDQAVIPAAGKMVDELTGWTPTFTRVSTAMADSTRQQGGNYKAAVAAASATAGLSLETEDWVEQALKASTTAKAGSKAMTEARDLMAASLGSANKPDTGIPIDFLEGSAKAITLGMTDLGFLLDRFRSGPAGSPQGLYGGYGGVGGTSFFAEQLGGGPGFQQQITDFMRVNTKPTSATGAAGTAQGIMTAAGSIFGPVGALVANQVSGAILSPLGGTTPGPGTKHMVANMQSAMGRAAGQEGVLAYGIRGTKGGEVERLDKMGADQTVIDMAKLGYVYTDSAGNLIASLDELDRAVGQVAKGMTIPDMGTWFKTITRQMGGQFQMAQQTQARAIETEIPIETWKNLVQQPLLGAGAGVVGKGGVSAAGFSGQTATWAKGLISDIQTSNQALTDMGKAGLEAARADVQTNNPLALPQFDTLAAEANVASAKIQGLNSEIARLSQEAAQANWANQIRIARRSLGDALGMLGRIGGTRLGQLQREQWLNSRASQQLGLQLQQRQITTQLALAQFQAPGETGEERYFRQKQTVAEAGVAQTQLGFSFKEFTISGQIWKITAERAATDATKAIEVMTVAQNAQLSAALAAQAISNEQRKLGVTMGKIDAILSTAKTNWGTVMQAAGQYVTQFGGSVKDAMKEVWKALGYTVKEDKYGKVSISGTSNAGQMGGPGYSAQPTDPRPAGENWEWNGYGWVKGNAKGYLGNFARGAMMTVGEAGPETVAILRNPRAAMMGGGGGSPSSVTVNINGPVVRNDQDISSLARQVAAEVERTLSRKGQMFGLRGPAV